MEYKAECFQVIVKRLETSYKKEGDGVRGVCVQVAVQQPKNVPRHKCKSIQEKKCRDVPHVTQELKCVHVPIQECTQVPVQVAVDVPRESCHQVPKKYCQTLPVRQPRIVTTTLPKTDC